MADLHKCLDFFNDINDVDFINIKKKIKELDFNRFLSVNLDESAILNSCRHCDSPFYRKWGRRNGMRRYKCNNCKKTFNTLTNTPLARLRKKEKWIEYADCLKKGLSVRKAASLCGIHSNTSFKWRHRFLENSTNVKADNFWGIIEMDSIFMIKSYKGSKDLPRRARVRGLSKEQKNNSKEKFSVFFAKSRSKYIFDKIFDKFCDKNIDFSTDNIFSHDNLLLSKDDCIYRYFANNKSIQHTHVKNRSNKLKNKIVHVNNVSLYYSKLLDWMKRFHGVATKYLDNYLSWYRFMDEFDMEIKPESIILRAHLVRKYKKLPLFVT